jgi:hypothetical protein
MIWWRNIFFSKHIDFILFCHLSKVIGTSVVSVRASPNTVASRA